MKQLVFERINSGGVKLEPQETRNALYDGPMNQLCEKLSRNKALCSLFKIPHRDLMIENQTFLDEWNDECGDEEFQKLLDENKLYHSMGDVELVLRFFAMRNLEGYATQFNDFLDAYLIEANKFPPSVLESLEALIEESILFADELLGEKAFYLWRPRKTKSGVSWGWFERPTTTVYDPLMYVLSQLLEKKQEILSHAEEIRANINSVYLDNYATFAGRNSNRSDIEKRIRIFRDFFEKYIED